MSPATEAFVARPELARLWRECRQRYERLGGPRGTVTLTNLSAAEADVLDGMLWAAESRRRTRLYAGASVRVELARLDERLRESGLGISLEAALEQDSGPLRDLPAQRARRAAERERVWTDAFAHPFCANGRGADARVWLEQLKATGALWRLGREVEPGWALNGALAVLHELPADNVELSRLATRVLGDTHALDYKRAVSTLVCGALADFADRERPTSARAWREEWRQAGVLCDGLSCTVLTLGICPSGESVVARAGRLHAQAAEPYVMTLRSLMAAAPLSFEHEMVLVSENPALVSAAVEALGQSCPPLICTGGWPNTAVTTLLEALSASGCELRVQCDGDSEGQGIHTHVRREHGAVPWLADEHRLGVQEEDVCDLMLDAAAATTPSAPTPDELLRPRPAAEAPTSGMRG
jgi:uncharacterized protein (TIGR02679 family)